MFKKFIDWLKRLWRDDIPDAVEQMYLDEYAPYIRERYGIREPFAPDDPCTCRSITGKKPTRCLCKE